ncbi:hypothetical protein LCGC14_1855380 [marine sediment metagenome]|uniref:Uncharacterized protein n=1 Tax=marine sediment metagenome TaxID=412755 RepID=A0A0F9G937_9ZZZZ
MKAYVDTSTPPNGIENAEIVGIIEFPEPIAIMDNVGSCTIRTREFEGNAYIAWNTLNFRKVRIEDDSSNVIWRGYIVKKTYTHDVFTMHCMGIGIVYQWKNFTQDYILAEGKVKTVNDGAILDLKTDDEDGGDPDFTWTVDEWHLDRDVGILLYDATDHTFNTATWTCSAVAVANEETIAGNAASVNTPYDNDAYHGHDHTVANVIDMVQTLTMDGDNIPRTSAIKKIVIDWAIKIQTAGIGYAEVRIILDKDGSPYPIGNIIAMGTPLEKWGYGHVVLEDTDAELLKFLGVDNGNYDEMGGVTVETYYSDFDLDVWVDHIRVTISYDPIDYGTIMEQVDDNAASSITVTGMDWDTDTKVQADDLFKFGQNTKQILSDIGNRTGLGIYIQSTLTKYIARHYKGSMCMAVLNGICELEGLHWWEDYVNDRIVVSKEADFVDSAVDLDSTDYEWDWTFEDDGNNYYRVDVFGSASLNIHAFKEDVTIDSPQTFTIINEQIVTMDDAQEVADTKFAELKTKVPSIILTVNGIQTALTVGKTVGLTMVRPTVGADDYPIRRIQKGKRGLTGIKTILYCGMGSSPIEEQLGKTIQDNVYRSQKAHTDRLISSPLSGSAHIDWTDISGRESGAVAAVNAAGLSLAATKVITSADEDLIFIFGRAWVGYTGYNNYAGFGHRSHRTTGSYALLQVTSGATILNTVTSRSIAFAVNDITRMSMSVTVLTMSIPIAMGTNKITGCGDPVAAQDVATKAYVDNSPIYQILMAGIDGFAKSDVYGAAYTVVFSDVNAAVLSTFYVVNGGSFKVSIIHSGTGNNFGKTAGGVINISYDVAGGLET